LSYRFIWASSGGAEIAFDDLLGLPRLYLDRDVVMVEVPLVFILLPAALGWAILSWRRANELKSD
jgi:hypothetical protein